VKTKITMAALAALLLAGPLRAEEAKTAKAAPTAKESVMTFLKNLKLALTQSAVQGERKKERSAAVAAVRGAGQSSELANPDEPSLKGDVNAAKMQQSQAEDAEIEQAVDLVLNGKVAEGIGALEAFKTKHPKSRSVATAQEAIDKAKTLLADKPAEDKSAPEKSAAPAPAAAKPAN